MQSLLMPSLHAPSGILPKIAQFREHFATSPEQVCNKIAFCSAKQRQDATAKDITRHPRTKGDIGSSLPPTEETEGQCPKTGDQQRQSPKIKAFLCQGEPKVAKCRQPKTSTIIW